MHTIFLVFSIVDRQSFEGNFISLSFPLFFFFFSPLFLLFRFLLLFFLFLTRLHQEIPNFLTKIEDALEDKKGYQIILVGNKSDKDDVRKVSYFPPSIPSHKQQIKSPLPFTKIFPHFLLSFLSPFIGFL